MKTFCSAISAFHGVKIGIYKTLYTAIHHPFFLFLHHSSCDSNPHHYSWTFSQSLFLSSSLNTSQLYESWQHPSITFSLTWAPVMKVVPFLLFLTACLKSSSVLAKTLEFFIAAVETKWEYVFTDTTDPSANQRWAILLSCTHNNYMH